MWISKMRIGLTDLMVKYYEFLWLCKKVQKSFVNNCFIVTISFKPTLILKFHWNGFIIKMRIKLLIIKVILHFVTFASFTKKKWENERTGFVYICLVLVQHGIDERIPKDLVQAIFSILHLGRDRPLVYKIYFWWIAI